MLVNGRGKSAIEDHFDVSYELERTLEEKGKHELLRLVRDVAKMVHVVSVRQKKPLGLGHAVLMARRYVGDEPFAVLLGDVIIDAKVPCTKQLIDVYETHGPVIALLAVPEDRTQHYGVISGKTVRDALVPRREAGRETRARHRAVQSRPCWAATSCRRPSSTSSSGRRPARAARSSSPTRSTSLAPRGAALRPRDRGQPLRRRRPGRLHRGHRRLRPQAARAREGAPAGAPAPPRLLTRIDSGARRRYAPPAAPAPARRSHEHGAAIRASHRRPRVAGSRAVRHRVRVGVRGRHRSRSGGSTRRASGSSGTRRRASTGRRTSIPRIRRGSPTRRSSSSTRRSGTSSTARSARTSAATSRRGRTRSSCTASRARSSARRRSCSRCRASTRSSTPRRR